MAAKILLLLANLSLCYATCLSSEVRRIYNPTHQVEYSPRYEPKPGSNAPRLIFIGDVHGMRTELDALLKEAEFSQERGDRVIFAGDMINKGPDSAKVLELAIEIDAASVRGNHEDRVLRTWAGAEIARTLAEANGEDSVKAVKAYEDSLTPSYLHALGTARTLTAEQRRWIADRPLALRLGSLPGFGELAVVHGGMAPGVSLEDQEPWIMYNIRSALYPNDEGEFNSTAEATGFHNSVQTKLKDTTPGTQPTEKQVEDEKKRMLEYYDEAADVRVIPIATNEGRWWVESWNEVERAKPEEERLTLIYGHDSNRGVQIKDFSKGLDSRCVNGVTMTAMIVEPDDEICEDSEEGVLLRSRLVSVPCPDGDTEP